MTKPEEKQACMPHCPHVYVAINDVLKDVGRIGISKDRKNQQQNYAFRGIDDVYEALNPLLAFHKLIIVPDVIERHVHERETKSGGVMFYVTLRVNYNFISAIDGTKYAAEVYGESMDTADKAINKAMSAAYKTLCLQVFCIPTEGASPDADETTPEPASKALPLTHKSPVNQLLQQVKALEEKIKSAPDSKTLNNLIIDHDALMKQVPPQVVNTLVNMASLREQQLMEMVGA